MSKEDRGANGGMKQSFGSAFGSTMGCFIAGIVIVIIVIAFLQG